MHRDNNKIIKYNPRKESMKVSFIIYAELKSFLEKMSTCHNNSGKYSTIKINEHKTSGYSLFPHCSFDLTKDKLDCYRGKLKLHEKIK